MAFYSFVILQNLLICGFGADEGTAIHLVLSWTHHQSVVLSMLASNPWLTVLFDNWATI